VKHVTQRPYLYYGLITTLIGSNFLFWGLAGINVVQAGKIPDGVTVHGQNLGGLTKDQAIQRLTPIHTGLQKKPITISIGDKNYSTSLSDLGYTIDTQAMTIEALNLGKSKSTASRLSSYVMPTQIKPLPIRFKIDKQKASLYIANLQQELPSPKDISLDYQNNTVKIIPAEIGATLDSDKTAKTFESEITNHIDSLSTITLPAEKVLPPLSKESQVQTAYQYAQKLVARPLTLQIEDTKIDISPTELYSYIVFSQKNDELIVTADESKIKAKAQDLAKKVSVSAESKKVSLTDNSVINEGRDGRKINADQTASLILQRVKAADTESPLVIST
jgi:hypothetical protein